MKIERTALPGVGMRHVFVTSRGRRVGVISHPGGRHDLIIYNPCDRDSADLVVLTNEEAGALAELLGSAQVVERFERLHDQIAGIVSIQVPILAGSPYDGKTLGETQTRSRTGASIVAVVREREVVASPGPDFTFRAGDTVIVVGTPSGTDSVALLLATG